MILNKSLLTHVRRRTISLVPLIDVVFILLLFFMLSTTLAKEYEIPIDQNQSIVSSTANESLLVILENDQGLITIRGESFDSTDKSTLLDLVRSNQSEAVYIEAKTGVHTQALIRLLDALKNAGVKNLSLKDSSS